MVLSVLLWLMFGLIIGISVSVTNYKNSTGIGPLAMLGIIGALVGGSLGQILGSPQGGFNFTALLIAVLGAITLIGLYKNISPQN